MSNAESNLPKARGLELMARRDNLVYEAAHAKSPEDLGRIIEALDAWQASLTAADWDALVEAEFGKGKAGRLAMVDKFADMSPIGQRR